MWNQHKGWENRLDLTFPLVQRIITKHQHIDRKTMSPFTKRESRFFIEFWKRERQVLQKGMVAGEKITLIHILVHLVSHIFQKTIRKIILEGLLLRYLPYINSKVIHMLPEILEKRRNVSGKRQAVTIHNQYPLSFGDGSKKTWIVLHLVHMENRDHWYRRDR